MDTSYFPANIYKTYKEYLNEKDTNRKLSLMFDVFAQIIRFFGCVFLSEYVYSDKVDRKLNDSIVGLTRPSLGSWLAFVREYVRYNTKENCSFIPEFPDVFINIVNFKEYSKQYIGRFRNPAVKKGGAFDEIIMLRNAIAHGAIAPTDEEASEIVGVYDQYIQKILSECSSIFKAYIVASAVEIEDEIRQYTAYFDLIRYDEKQNDMYPVVFQADQQIMGIPVDEYIIEGQMYLLCDDGRVLRFAEYLVDIIGDDEHEDYYLYDGYGNSYVAYIGMKYKKHLEKYLEAIKSKLTEKGARTRWDKRFFEYESFCNYINSLTDVSINIHKKNRKYIPRVYIRRECDHLLYDFIETDKTTMIVSAEAGVGKTNFLCHSAEELIKSGNTVYFTNGSTLTETNKDNVLFLKLQNECLDEKDFHNMQDFLSFLSEKNTEKNRFIIIVDAANEAYNMLSVLQEIDTVTSYAGMYPWLKIIISVRTVSYCIFKNRMTDKYGKKLPFLTDRDRYFSVVKDGEKSYVVQIEEWNIVQVIEAFDKYRKVFRIDEKALSFHNMERRVQELLKNPLNMGIFFDAQNNMPELKIQTEEDIFMSMERFWNENDEVTKSVKGIQNRIVDEMKRLRCNELDSDIVRDIDEKLTPDELKDIRLLLLTPLERLRDAGIIFEREEDGVFLTSFVYQKYLEYQLLRNIKADAPDTESIVDLMIEAGEWDKLPEMYMACLEYLKQKANPVDTAKTVMDMVIKKELPLTEFQSTLLELLGDGALKGQSLQVAEVVTRYNIRPWGIILVRRLNESEESDAVRDLLDALMKPDEDVDEELYYLRGLYHMKVSELDEAKADLSKCINSSDAKLRNAATVQLAKNYRKAGEVAKAKDLLENFTNHNDEKSYNYADAIIQLGLCKYSEHLYEEALADYNKALILTTEHKDYHATIYNMLGISTVRAEMGELDECERILLEVYKMAGEHSYIDLLSDSLNGLATNYNRKKEYEKAVSYAEQALMIWEHSHYYTGMMVMYCRLIEAYSQLGNRDDDVKKNKDAADAILPKIKEKVILDCYNKAMTYIKKER